MFSLDIFELYLGQTDARIDLPCVIVDKGKVKLVVRVQN
jgi:hypothetical protein